MKVKLGWWNTSLHHRGKADAQHASLAIDKAVDVIRHLFSAYQLDALGLCEVSAKHLADMAAALGPGFTDHAFNERWGGRHAGDLGLIARDATALVVSHRYESHQIEKRALAIGVSIVLEVNDLALAWVISHWPSRRYLPRGAPERQMFGAALRSVVKQWATSEPRRHIILAGDYNDEPFDDSLASQLMATRDTSRLINAEVITYKPFWRKLGTHEAFLNARPGQQAAGTYRYASGRETTWHTFDQMIFSREFIVGHEWRLNEIETGIVADSDIFQLVRSTTYRFDHLPIIGVVEATP